MKIAVTLITEMFFSILERETSRFAKCSDKGYFKLAIGSNGTGHGALARLLAEQVSMF